MNSTHISFIIFFFSPTITMYISGVDSSIIKSYILAFPAILIFFMLYSLLMPKAHTWRNSYGAMKSFIGNFIIRLSDVFNLAFSLLVPIAAHVYAIYFWFLA